MKQFNTILAIILIALFAACSNGNKKNARIGFLIHATTSSRWQMDIAYVKERAAQIGATVILKDAGGDENMQLKQATELIEEGVDAIIVVAANQNTAAGIVREAHKAKIPVIGYDRLIKNSDLDYLVSFEYEKVGTLMVEYMLEKLEKGNFVLLWGDAIDANAIMVKNGIEKAFENNPKSSNFNLIYKTYVPDWTYSNANHIMKDVLAFTPQKIDAVIACNDPLGIGAYDALIEYGYKPGEVLITGQDATLEYVHSMLNNGMTMSVAKPIKELAYGAVDLVADLVRTGKAEGFDSRVNNGRKDVPAKLFSPRTVDVNNFEDVLVEGGVFTRDQVFGKK